MKYSKQKELRIFCSLACGLVPLWAGSVQAQTTAFTYQGKLTDAGNPANGNYDLQFKLFDTPTVGTVRQSVAQCAVAKPNRDLPARHVLRKEER